MAQITKRPLVVLNVDTAEHKLSIGCLIKEHESFRYEVREPVLSKEMRSAYYDSLYFIQNRLTERNLRADIRQSYPVIERLMKSALLNKGHSLSKTEEVKVIYYLYRDLIGFGMIESLCAEPEINFVLCEGLGRPVRVYHNEHGFIETNVIFKNGQRLSSLIRRMLNRCTKTNADGTRGILPDKSFVETDGQGFCLRKSKIKFTPEFLIKNKTATPAALAYLDSLMKHSKSIMIVGPKNSGKTGFLSGLLHMLDSGKIIKIVENEPLLAIDNTNWSTRLTIKKDAHEAVEKYLRFMPDYLVVDEISEKDAKYTIHSLSFVPGIICFEAGNTDVAVNRLVNRFKVPKSFLANIDVIVMLNPKREIEEIIEIQRYEKEKNELNAKVVFRKEHDRLAALESRFMRTLSTSKIEEMKQKAKELHAFSKK